MKTGFLSAMFLAVISLATVSEAAATQAKPAGPLWSCRLESTVTGTEIGFVVAWKELSGEGTMSCDSVSGDYHEVFPIKITIRGLGLGIGYSEVTSLQLVTGAIGVTDPRYLYGKYHVGLSAGVTLVRAGISFNTGLSLSKKGIGFEAGLVGQEAEGYMASIQLQDMQISPLQ